MKIQAPSRPRPSLGRGARMRLFSALITSSACLAVACSDDDPAPQTGIGGSGATVDASVRDLPGDGTEPTPESDIENRQRNPIGPDGLNEALDPLRNPGSSADADEPDAAPGDLLDAGAG